MGLTIPGVQLADFFDQLYGEPGCLDPSGILRALFEALRKQLAFSSGFFLQFDPSDLDVSIGYVYGMSDEDMRPYSTHYYRLDPYRIRLPNLRSPNQVVRASDFVDLDRLANAEFGEAMRLFDYFYAMAISPFVRGRPVGAFAVHRPRRGGDFTVRERTLFRWFVAHATRAMDYRRLAARLLNPGPATIVIAPADRRILSMSEEACSILSEMPEEGIFVLPADAGHNFVWLSAGKVYAVRAEDVGRDSLWRLPLVSAMNWQTVPFHLSKKLQLAVGRGREPTLIVIERLEDIEHAHAALGGFGLSPRQEQVAVLMVLGKGLKEIARTCAISPNTAKEYASEVYRRLDVHSRRDFLFKVMGIVPAVTGRKQKQD